MTGVARFFRSDPSKPDQLLLTKVRPILPSESSRSSHLHLLPVQGDNNPSDDVILYKGERWLKRSNVVGKVRGCVLSLHQVA